MCEGGTPAGGCTLLGTCRFESLRLIDIEFINIKLLRVMPVFQAPSTCRPNGVQAMGHTLDR